MNGLASLLPGLLLDLRGSYVLSFSSTPGEERKAEAKTGFSQRKPIYFSPAFLNSGQCW